MSKNTLAARVKAFENMSTTRLVRGVKVSGTDTSNGAFHKPGSTKK